MIMPEVDYFLLSADFHHLFSSFGGPVSDGAALTLGCRALLLIRRYLLLIRRVVSHHERVHRVFVSCVAALSVKVSPCIASFFIPAERDRVWYA